MIERTPLDDVVGLAGKNHVPGFGWVVMLGGIYVSLVRAAGVLHVRLWSLSLGSLWVALLPPAPCFDGAI